MATFEQEIKSYKSKQLAAANLIEIISNLWINHGIELVLFRNQLIDRRGSLVLRLHQQTKTLMSSEIPIEETLAIAQCIQDMTLPLARIDIGTLALQARNKEPNDSLLFFVQKRLAPIIHHPSFSPKDVVLYGFGRIGRLLTREIINHTVGGSLLRLRAIVTRDRINSDSLQKRANLLLQDSIHGDFQGIVEVDSSNNSLIINGNRVYIISADKPQEIDYSIYGIQGALIIDNTGVFRDEIELSQHLKAKGVSQVLLTAPGKGIPNIVYGVNDFEVKPLETTICSAASCTTNAISPVLSILEDTLGIVKGHIETIHAYTNDQNLVDNMHKKSRRGRAAALNMVITETGAGTAVAKVIPSLQGKLSSNAIRVPVPNGSLAILQLELKTPCNKEQLLDILKNAAMKGALVEQLKFETNPELVSSDIIGASAAAVIDASATIVSNNGENIILYVWYDNEYGYTHQVLRLAKHVAGVKRYTYY